MSDKLSGLELCSITARQYGEVVLPDASTGHDPDTLARKLSRCKEGTAWFLPSGYKFYRSRACRGTKLISETDLSRCNKCYKMGTGAVSRYNFDRSQKTVTMQDFFCGHVRVSGCKFWQDLSWEQDPAKTMTNNLPILSVLWCVIYLKI
jgi:hypothetical protein